MDIPVKPLQEFLAGIKHIDLLSIDAEGKDAEILQTYNWRIKPTVIIAETDLPLIDEGYHLVAECGPSHIWQLRQ